MSAPPIRPAAKPPPPQQPQHLASAVVGTVTAVAAMLAAAAKVISVLRMVSSKVSASSGAARRPPGHAPGRFLRGRQPPAVRESGAFLGLLGDRRPGRLDLRLHGIEVETRASLHGRELDRSHRQLLNLLLDEDEAP